MNWKIWLLIFVVLGSILAIVPLDFTKGIEITSVEQNSTAYEQGLRQGQIITSVNGIQINDLEDFSNALAGKFSSNENINLLVEQAEEFKPEVVAIGSEKLYPDLKSKIRGKAKIFAGEEALREIAGTEKADIVVIAISGTASLMPLMSALEAGRTVALASKEPVVSAGKII